MTVRVEDIVEPSMLLVEVVKGIVSTYLLFWALSGLLIFFAKLNQKSYLRGLRIFTIREICSHINTNVFAAGTICLFLFITICIFSSCFSMNHMMNKNLRTLAPMDINMAKMWSLSASDDEGEKIVNTLPETYNAQTVRECMVEQGIDESMFTDVVEVIVYRYLGKQEVPTDIGFGMLEPESSMVLCQSDFNQLAKGYNLKPVSLAPNEYVMVSNYETMVKEFDKELAKGTEISFGQFILRPQKSSCHNGFIDMSASYDNFGFFVVPDEVVKDNVNLRPHMSYYIANYNETHTLGKEKITELMEQEEFQAKLGIVCVTATRASIEANSIGVSMLVVFMGLYLGITFILASVALLSLKELSQAADNREKYSILRKIGVEERMMHRSLLGQSLLFFMAPLVLAGIHSIFGIKVCVYIMETYGRGGMLPAIIFTASVLLVIYLIYFVITYRCSCRIIDER